MTAPHEDPAVKAWIEEHGPTVQVAFTCPVEVVVNLETGRVERVVEITEGIEIDAAVDGGAVVHTTTDYQDVINVPVRVAAGAIADLDEPYDHLSWPAWEAGF